MNSGPLSMRNALGIPCFAISFSNTAQTFCETKLVSTSMAWLSRVNSSLTQKTRSFCRLMDLISVDFRIVVVNYAAIVFMLGSF